MAKMAKQPANTSWEGRWARSVALSLQQLQAQHSEDRSSRALEEKADAATDRLDAELDQQIREGLDQPRERFNSALNMLGNELATKGILQEYDRFCDHLNEAAQTFHWEAQTVAGVDTPSRFGRSVLFGLSLMTRCNSAAVGHEWDDATNLSIAHLLTRTGQVSAQGRLVLLPIALNTAQTAEFEPWMGYRLTGLLHQWAGENAQGNPSAADARAMLSNAGLCQQGSVNRLTQPTALATEVVLRQMTIIGLQIPYGESNLSQPDGDGDSAQHIYDFPQSKFDANVAGLEMDLEDVLLALSMRQGGSTLDATAELASATNERFAPWPLVELRSEAIELCLELDEIRARHPLLVAAGTGPHGFGVGELAHALSELLSPQLMPPGATLSVQPAGSATLVFEATDKGLCAFRDLSFRAQASAVAARFGTGTPDGMVADIDHNRTTREFQVTFHSSGHGIALGCAQWPVLAGESFDESLDELVATLDSMDVKLVRSDTLKAPRLH